MVADLTYEAFAQQVNSRFQVQLDQQNTVELELTEISEAKREGNQEQFSIVFRGPANAFLGQETRSVSHPEMGQFHLFLVPVNQDAEGFYYEAVFNRFRE